MQKTIKEQNDHLRRFGTLEFDQDSFVAIDRLWADRRRQGFAELTITFKNHQPFSVKICTEILWADILAAMKANKKH